MNLTQTARLSLVLATAVFCGCTGGIRETTTARTSTEQLLVSEAAARAIKKYEGDVKKLLSGRRVAIDDSRFESLHKPYGISAIRNLLARNKVTIVPIAPEKVKTKGGKEIERHPDYILEIRAAALGIKDSDFGFGVPPLPIPIPQTNLTSVAPGLFLFNRDKQEGWAKFQFWLYQPKTKTYLSQSKDLWGKTYYTQWTFFGIGPFDFSEDIYPDESVGESFK